MLSTTQEKVEQMLSASFCLSPTFLVLLILSLPARSQKLSMDPQDVAGPGRAGHLGDHLDFPELLLL
jgi:hypothetical protein